MTNISANTFSYLKAVDSCQIFSKAGSDTFRSVLVYGEEPEAQKICHNCTKKIIFLRGFDRRNTFLDIEKSNSKNLLSNDSKCKTISRG